MRAGHQSFSALFFPRRYPLQTLFRGQVQPFPAWNIYLFHHEPRFRLIQTARVRKAAARASCRAEYNRQCPSGSDMPLISLRRLQAACRRL